MYSLDNSFELLNRKFPHRHPAEPLTLGAIGARAGKVPEPAGRQQVSAKRRKKAAHLYDLVPAHAPDLFLRGVTKPLGPFVVVVQKVAGLDEANRKRVRQEVHRVFFFNSLIQ